MSDQHLRWGFSRRILSNVLANANETAGKEEKLGLVPLLSISQVKRRRSLEYSLCWVLVKYLRWINSLQYILASVKLHTGSEAVQEKLGLSQVPPMGRGGR